MTWERTTAQGKLLRNRLTAFPLKSFLAKGHCYPLKLGARQIVSQQHSPEIIQGEGVNTHKPKIKAMLTILKSVI
jgi:hypothetical protein